MVYPPPPLEPIALVGSSCRFAGGVQSPYQLWQLLSKPSDLSKPAPSQRFSIDGFTHPDTEHHGTTNASQAYWLEQDHRVFDTSFFNITPKEAEAMDPQQRLTLEVVYEALESAGYTLQQHAGQDVAVYIGVMTSDYATLTSRDDLNSSQYTATGTAGSIISNRVSYFFDFHGPSMTIDTACSSSLVALHQAVQSLRSGECPMACVTGTNLILTPDQFISESKLHMLSPTGHSRMWDAKADGYARGEGVAAFFLKTLTRALADGDNIQAIIRETGVNSDGRTKGITMPSSVAQTALIKETYKRSGLDPLDIHHRPQYFEAHGTGTPVGDPIEARAISEAFFPDNTGDGIPDLREKTNEKLLVGSVKTVIGHTEGAAGLAGVLKVIQAMNHGVVPPNLHLDTLNPNVAPFYKDLEIPVKSTPWPLPPLGQPHRASVNCFGFGGTNSHAIIEKYDPEIHNWFATLFDPRLPLQILHPTTTPSTDHTSGQPSIVLPFLFSAANPKSLLSTLTQYKDYFINNPNVDCEALGWNLYRHRTTYPFRAAITADSIGTTLDALDTLISSAKGQPGKEPNIGVRSKQIPDGPKILGVFTGQGAQYVGMSKGLFHINSVFRETIRALDDILKTCPYPPDGWSIEEQLLASKETSQVSTAAVSQLLCTVIQIALVDLLKSIGITFRCVVGHSSGEIAAAYAAGRLLRRDAMLIAYYRGRCTKSASSPNGGKGGMLACGLSKEEATEFCSRPEYMDRLCVAASNSPTLVTLSGDLDMVIRAVGELKEKGVFARQLNVDSAYHSPHMRQPVLEYSKILAESGIEPLTSDNGTYWASSTYGTLDEVNNQDLVVKYWADNMISPVLFQEAFKAALDDCGPFDCVIEIGPHPALKSPATEIMKANLPSVLPYMGVLNRNREDRLTFADFLGNMWTYFGPSSINIDSYVEGSPRPDLKECRLLDLPSYPWDHSQIHWRESRLSEQFHFRKHPPHELLGVRTKDDNQFQLRWRNILTLEQLPWIEGHKFQGQALLPASAYCVMAVDAAKAFLNGRVASIIELQNLEFLSGITLVPDSLGVEILFTLSVLPYNAAASSSIEAEFTLTSVPVSSFGFNPMKKNFQGKLRIILDGMPPQALPNRTLGSQAETLPVNTDAFYHMMEGIGLQYTGPFKALKSIDRRLNYASASLSERHLLDTTSLSISPATFDSCLQATFVTFSSPGDKALWTSFLPTKIASIRFNQSAGAWQSHDSEIYVESNLTAFEPYSKASPASVTSDVEIFNQLGGMDIQVQGLTVSSFTSTKPEDDYELYLHTVMDMDPEDEIITTTPYLYEALDFRMVEDCELVIQHFLNQPSPIQRPHTALSHTPPESPIISAMVHRDTKDGQAVKAHTQDPDAQIRDLIQKSPYSSTLEFIRTVCKDSPKMVLDNLSSITEDGQQLFGFQKHVGRIVQQMAHRYPRMRILGLTDPQFNLTKHILDGLSGAFLSYTVGCGDESNLYDRLPHLKTDKKVSVKPLDFSANNQDVVETTELYDLIILTSSVLQQQSSDHLSALRFIRKLTKTGGFLVLIDLSREHFLYQLESGNFSKETPEPPNTPPQWPNWLDDDCGFTTTSRNSNQYYPPLFSLYVRQATDNVEGGEKASPPSVWHDNNVMTEHLLIVGGQSQEVKTISAELKDMLSSQCNLITSVKNLEDVTPTVATSCTALILLADIEEPVCSSLTASRIEVLKSLVRPEMVILWVTTNGLEDPDRAASFGFTRSLKGEIPNLTLQVLDLDTINDCSATIFKTFCTLRNHTHSIERTELNAILWSDEPEIHMERGKRLIPRVLPYRPANDRLNAYRRCVTTETNTLDNCVLLKPIATEGHSIQYIAHDIGEAKSLHENRENHLVIYVDYSSSHPVRINKSGPIYTFAGHFVDSTRTVFGLTDTLASIIRVDASAVRDLSSPNIKESQITAVFSQMLSAINLVKQTKERNIVLIEPTKTFVHCVRAVLTSPIAQKNGVPRLIVWSCDENFVNEVSGAVFIHPWSTARQIQRALPKMDYAVFNYLPQSNQLSKTLFGIQANFSSRGIVPIRDGSPASFSNSTSRTAWTMSLDLLSKKGLKGEDMTLVAPSELLGTHSHIPMDAVVDWKSDRLLPIDVKPLVNHHHLRQDRTYILIGLTRDLGQSICRLFLQHGARYIIVASRNPDKSPAWVSELNAQGAMIRVKRLDVTNLDQVQDLHLRITMHTSFGMPPVAGIVNGAMVLEDRVFAKMDIDTWTRVMRPKTVGSKNLDIVFGATHNLDFFIMTSSFAAIGGHAGQSNYAAANMYMNGLAANRRRRGLAGSVLNIGVIYGLGLLARERQDIYVGLERDGYPPISERDLHHMFMEAIEAGRPTPGQIMDLTTGLARYRVNDPNPLHWHHDLRFCHYTANEDDNEQGINGQQGDALKQTLKEAIDDAQSVQAATDVLLPSFCRRLESILQLSTDSVNGDARIDELGVDSLAAVELRNWLYKSVGQDVPVMKILGASSILKLCIDIAENIIKARETPNPKP